MNVSLIKNIFPYFIIVTTLIGIFSSLNKITPQRVGDGSEYYALFYAWSDTFRPWMSNISFDSYGKFVSQEYITGLVATERLANAFPTLRVRETADFNHFWFYSFLAFIASKILFILGLPNGSHHGFLALHFILLIITATTAFKLYNSPGIYTIVLLIITSPILWYLDKVHTELFTFCTTLLALIFILKGNCSVGSFFFALASTQNPSFAIIASVPFLYRILLMKQYKFTVFDLIFMLGTITLIILHPLYYFFRYGIPTPQLLAGGATFNGNILTSYIWIFDPDIGLLPNWPFGIIFILLSSILIAISSNIVTFNKNTLFFCILFFIFFVVNFYAHSSTTNINSGATTGVSRYALWYLPAFFPLVNFVISNCKANKYIFVIFVFSIISCVSMNVIINNPLTHENYSTPTFLSSFIQTNFSEL